MKDIEKYEKVTVTIKPELAAKGRGFSDLEYGQEIRPRLRKDGSYDTGQENEVYETPFVRSRIQSGELQVVSRQGKKETGKDPANQADGRKK